MLATHAFSLSLHSATPAARPCLLSNPRPALVDSTNINLRPTLCDSGWPKTFVYQTSSVRTGCGWNDIESSTGPISTPFHSRHYYFASAPSPFPVTYKAPPTVSVSLSAACSQSVLGERSGGLSAQGLEPDLPDVRNVVPFPSAPLDGDMDVEMADGTCVPCPGGHVPSSGQARKRRSACASISSSQGSLAKDTKQKRQRKSKRQVTELWWLGVIHRSILRGIETRQSAGELQSDSLLPGLGDFDVMDRALAERIRKRLVENDCVEGRALPSPLPRISSPTISVPSLNLSAPSRKTLPINSASLSSSSELNPKENSSLDGILVSPPAFKESPRAPLSIIPYSPIPPSTSTSHKRHVRFEVLQRPRQPRSYLSIPPRSPSPPARTGTVPTTAQTLTLTMPQLVASLTLAFHERGKLRLRGRASKSMECGKNAGHSLSSVPCQTLRFKDGDGIQDKERIHQSFTLRARLSSAPERKSPLSRVAYAEG